MKRPDEIYKTWRNEMVRQLIAEAVPQPRKYFRASEVGGCMRRTYFDMIGYRPRPQRIEDWLRGRAGDLAHLVMADALSRVFKLEMVEATDEGENSLVFHQEWEGRDLEFHIRPDGILAFDDDNPLYEGKSTTTWGVRAARSSGVWYPSWVDQCQISMHFIRYEDRGPGDTFLLQSERNNFDMIGDNEAFGTIKYDEKRVHQIFNKCVDVLERVERFEADGTIDPPPMGCTQKSKGKTTFVFNSCQHNDQMVSGLQSEALCGGG